MRRVLMISTLMLLAIFLGAQDSLREGMPNSPVSTDAAASVSRSLTGTGDGDIASLPAPYQEMALRILSEPASERPPLAVCFGPETDPEVVRQFTTIMASHSSSLDYFVGSRWSTTANGSTGGQGNPATLTYSFPPDGISLPSGAGEPPAPNSLNAMMTSKFGSVSAWKAKFAQCFAQWEALTGVHYQEVADDGASFPGSPGLLGARGDVRITSHTLDGQYGILAYNYFPNTGDMVLDASEPWGGSANDFRFLRNIILHEHGHGLGISHVCPINQTKLLEPYLSLAFDGPQHDEIRAGQRSYGDRYENNDTYTTATNLGSVGSGTTVNNVSTDNPADTDWYQFSAGAGAQVTATLTPVGRTYYSDPQSNSGACPAASSQLNTLDDQNLDMRLYSADGTTVLATAASTGAGSVETLPATTVAAGTYYLRVQNGSSNDGVQLYALQLATSGGGGTPTAAITVSSPNGGETWTVGSSATVSWTSANLSENVKIELNRSYPSGAWETLAASAANSGSYSVTLAGVASTTARVRITGATTTTACDTSNANFTIAAPSGGTPTLTLSAPNGGETWAVGSTQTIVWTSANLSENVKLELNRSYSGGVWETIIAATANDGSHSWVVTSPTTTTARIRVSGAVQTGVTDVANANFTIGGGSSGGASLTLTAPNGGEQLALYSYRSITWTSSGLAGYLRIQLNRNYPTGAWESITSYTTNDGNHIWRVSGAATTHARIRVLSASNAAVGDTSDADFAIGSTSGGSAMTLISPNGGERLVLGSIARIAWSAPGYSGNLKIEINRNYPTGVWQRISAMTANDGSYTWGVTGPATTNARMRITAVYNAMTTDVSNASFTIATTQSGVSEPGDVSTLKDAPGAVPTEAYLGQNYPNPFNPSTMIEFGLPVAGNVKLRVYDVTGREVAVLLDSPVAAGHHRVNWSCAECSVGIYMIVLTGDNFRQVQKATFLK